MSHHQPIVDLEDPRLTAYALGELEGEERLLAEAFVASRPEAAAAVEEIRAAAGALTDALLTEAAPALHDAQRRAIEERIRRRPIGSLRRGWFGARVQLTSGLAAAAVAITAGVAWMTHDTNLALREVSNVARFERPAERGFTGGVSKDAPEAAKEQVNFGVVLRGAPGGKEPGAPLKSGDVAGKPVAGNDKTVDTLEELGRSTKGADDLSAQSGSPEYRKDPQWKESEKRSLETKTPALSEVERRAGADVSKGESTILRLREFGETLQKTDPAAAPVTPATTAGSAKGEESRRTSDAYKKGAGAQQFGGKPGDADRGKAPTELKSDFEIAKSDLRPGAGGAAPTDLKSLAGGGGGGQVDGTRSAKAETPGSLAAPGAPSAGFRSSGPSTPGPGTTGGRGAERKSRREMLDLDAAKAPSGDVGADWRGLGRGDNSTLVDNFVEFTDDENELQSWRFRTPGTESYKSIVENRFTRVADDPRSTFSMDVDSASYSNVRRFLNDGWLPPRDAVRVEEMVNYFKYDYAPPTGNAPFAAYLETAQCPWAPKHQLVRIGLKARETAAKDRKPGNLIFLVDVSGSMRPDDRLPLVKQGLKLLTHELGEDDQVGIVTYAGASSVTLPPTNGSNRKAIEAAIDSLQAGGSTNGGSGIQLAYDLAQKNFIKGGVNRVILATDGDFNVGVTDNGSLEQLITEKAKSGVFLTCLGVGRDNLKDSRMMMLADKGNGVYAYLDSQREARRVLVEQMHATLETVAKDAKIQVEFNPKHVASFRLLGYEKRALEHADFANDKKDAGDVGAGACVTVLYEIVPADAPRETAADEDELVFQPNVKAKASAAENTLPKEIEDMLFFSSARASAPAPVKAAVPKELEDMLLLLKIRAKEPAAKESNEWRFFLKQEKRAFEQASPDFRFQACAAAFSMLLRGSRFSGGATLDWVLETGEAVKGADPDGYRREFLDLVFKAKSVK